MPYRLTNIWNEVVTLHVKGQSLGLAAGASRIVDEVDPTILHLQDTKRLQVEEVTTEVVEREAAVRLLQVKQRDLLHHKKKVAMGAAPKEDLMRRLAPEAPEPKSQTTPRPRRGDKTA